MASREPRPCGAAFSEWTTSPPPFAASAPLTPCRHEPANRAHSTRDPNDRQQPAYSSLSDADLWGKISAGLGQTPHQAWNSALVTKIGFEPQQMSANPIVPFTG